MIMGRNLLGAVTVLCFNPASSNYSNIAKVVRCPIGWIPRGPYCTTTLTVPPYTECPWQKKRYRQPYATFPAYISPAPGVCMSQEGSGLLLRCGDGLTLELNPRVETPNISVPKKRLIFDPSKPDGRRLAKRKGAELGVPSGKARRLNIQNDNHTLQQLNSDTPEQRGDEKNNKSNDTFFNISIEEVDSQAGYERFVPDVTIFDEEIQHWRSPSEYRCVGVDQRLFSAAEFERRNKKCPNGYILKQTFTPNNTLFPEYADRPSVICEGYPVLPPEPICPDEYVPSLIDFDASRFFGIQSMHCARTTQFKGRLWCPDTFMISQEPYPGLPLGAEIKLHSLDPEVDTFKSPLIFGEAPALCVRSVSVPFTQCNQNNCKAPILSQLAIVIKKFAYFRLQRDPRYIKFIAEPSGNDLKWSASEKRFPT